MAFGARSMHATGHVDGINRDHVADLLAASGALFGAMPPDIARRVRSICRPGEGAVASDARGHAGPGDRVEHARRRWMGCRSRSPAWAAVHQAPADGIWRRGAGRHCCTPGSISASMDWTAQACRRRSRPTCRSISRSSRPCPACRLRICTSWRMTRPRRTRTSSTLAPDIAAMFSHGGADARHGGAGVRPGTGESGGHRPRHDDLAQTWHGEAHVAATGFDELDDPGARRTRILQQALPVLIMLRGMAKPDGERLVWDIVSDGP